MTQHAPHTVLRAELAAAIARFILVDRAFVEKVRPQIAPCDPQWLERERAFNALETAFEKDFPRD